MEQTNMVMAMYQAMAAQGMAPKTGKSGDKSGDFQKLLDQKAQSKPAKSDAPAQEKPKADGATAGSGEAPVREDPLEQVKKLAEQGYAITQPGIAAMTLAGQTYEPGEYVMAWKGPDMQLIPVTGLDQPQMQQLDQFLTGTGAAPELDVSDPEADALLEATAPGADNSPAKLLEEAVDEQAGQVAGQAAEEAKPQEKKGDVQAEITGVEQGPQRIFHDVKAAPMKVGEVYDAQQAEGPDVAQQIDAQIAQAMQRGESTVTVKLNPENLGEVTVQMSVKNGGVLAVAISARNDDTRALLERHAGNLQELLSSRVHDTVEVNVQRGQESQQNQNQHSYDGHNGHAQDGQERRQQRREHTAPEDFMQQLRLGLIPEDGEF